MKPSHELVQVVQQVKGGIEAQYVCFASKGAASVLLTHTTSVAFHICTSGSMGTGTKFSK